MPDAAPKVDLGIERAVLARRNRPTPVGESYAQATTGASEQAPQTAAGNDPQPAPARPAKKQPGKPAAKKSTTKRASRTSAAAKKSAPATSAELTPERPAQQAQPSVPAAVPSAPMPEPTPTTASEDQALAAAGAGEPASSTVDTPERPPRRVASVPSALAEAIAERCQRTGMRRRELVLAALEAHADELADLVAKDNAPKVKKVGLWEVPVDKKSSGHMTINMHLTPNNAVIMDDLVRRSGARGISQAVTVALAAYLGVQNT